MSSPFPCPVSSIHMSHIATVGIEFCSHNLVDINIRWIIRKTLYIYACIYIYIERERERERERKEQNWKKIHYSLLLKNVAYVRRLLYFKSLWFFRKLWILVLVYHFWNILFSFTVFQIIKLFRKILESPCVIYCIKIVSVSLFKTWYKFTYTWLNILQNLFSLR